MPWAAAAATVGGALIGANASRSAANTQANAAKDANATQLAMYNQTRQDQAPWRNAGQSGLNAMLYGLGLGGSQSGASSTAPQQGQDNFDATAYLKANPDVAQNQYWSQRPWDHYLQHGSNEGRAFTGNTDYQSQLDAYNKSQATGTPTAGQGGGIGYGDLLRKFQASDYQADPGYQFRLDQGQQSINRNALAAGRYNSGAALKDLTAYNSGQASQEYGNAYNRFNNDQTTQFNRLAALSGIGQNATNQIQLAGTNAGNNIAQNQMGAGNALAAGQIGSANAWSNGLSQAGNAFMQQNYLNNMRQPMIGYTGAGSVGGEWATGGSGGGWNPNTPIGNAGWGG
jgi:hypothetical protein